jgi:Haem-degrading
MTASGFHRAVVLSAVGLGVVALCAVQGRTAQADCRDLPSHADLQDTLEDVVDGGGNAGLANEMWGTIVDRDGIVCAVAFTGDDRGDQWPGSRVISAQKANTANAFSLPGDAGFGGALSSGNLYGTVLEQGSLLGLQFSNPVDTAVGYKGPASKFGRSNDPMTGKAIGGVNVFGGGLALYDASGELLGGLGVSGDTSCTDHVVAWKVRDGLDLDDVPGGVAPPPGGAAPNFTDNLNIVTEVTPGSFEHPDCGGGVADIIAGLPTVFPIGPTMGPVLP